MTYLNVNTLLPYWLQSLVARSSRLKQPAYSFAPSRFLQQDLLLAKKGTAEKQCMLSYVGNVQVRCSLKSPIYQEKSLHFSLVAFDWKSRHGEWKSRQIKQQSQHWLEVNSRTYGRGRPPAAAGGRSLGSKGSTYVLWMVWNSCWPSTETPALIA